MAIDLCVEVGGGGGGGGGGRVEGGVIYCTPYLCMLYLINTFRDLFIICIVSTSGVDSCVNV